MDLGDAIGGLDPIGLDALDQRAALQDRTDVKRVVDRVTLRELLHRLRDDHEVLEIDGRRVFAYESVYFDTPELRCLHEHVADVRPRFKVRTRRYVDAGRCVFEVKLKDPSGEMRKSQQEHDPAAAATLTPDARELLARTLADAGIAEPGDLEPALLSDFTRVTLAARDAPARLTADVRVQLRRLDGDAVQLRPELAIVETKSEDGRSAADRALEALGVPPVSLSKYRVGADLLLKPGPPDAVQELFAGV